jgi:hypothetical protein
VIGVTTIERAIILLARHTRETLSTALVARGISPGRAAATAIAVLDRDGDGTHADDRAWMRAILSGNLRAIDLLVDRCARAQASGGPTDLRCETGEFTQ